MAGRGHKKANPFGSRTDVGRVRAHNEDSLIVAPPLYVVCDGMGGHATGEVASEIAVSTIADLAPQHADAEALGKAVEAANHAIIRAAREGLGREGMGTTCTAAILDHERLVVAQVGDSRAYLLHKGHLQQLTRDHSLMADMIESGQITPEEAKTHPRRAVITRALGSNPHTSPDLYEINVEPGDRLLLCSDGLSGMLEDYEIKDVLSRISDPQQCASQLVNEANEAGGMDNITAVVVDVTGFADARRRTIARRTKVTAGLLVGLLALIMGGAVLAFDYMVDHSAYLTEENGKVAIYKGIPGEVLGMSFTSLVEVTQINVGDLQPGTASRLTEGVIRVDGVGNAYDLAESYAEEISERTGQPVQAFANSDAVDVADSADAVNSDDGDSASANSDDGDSASASSDDGDNAAATANPEGASA